MMGTRSMLFLAVIAIFLTACCAWGHDLEVDGSITVRLQHYLSENGDLDDRGNVTVQSIRSGSYALAQSALMPHHISKLKALAKSGGIYRMRATVTSFDGRETPFLTFIKACALAESSLSDSITIALDHAGGVVAVSLSAPFIVCRGQINSDDKLRHFNTTVVVKHTENGPIPDTASFISKLEREREARERGAPVDNRSFLAKYWMVIVPLLIFVLLSSAGQPEGPGAGGR